MKLTLVSLLLLATPMAFAGLEPYESLVRADAAPGSRDSIRVTYLGVNGYQLEAGDHALLIDPYFTRASLADVALQRPLVPNESRVAAGLKHVRDRVDVIVVTHAHFDHLLDASPIMQATRARLMGGKTAVHLAVAAGAPRERCSTVDAGATRSFGPWKIHVLRAAHDRLFGRVPYSGALRADHKPQKPRDWVVGEPFAYVIEANGRRVYVDSGGVPASAPQLHGRRIDLAIVSVALPDSRKRYARAVRNLNARFVLPSHQDNFFAPFARGFSFGLMTNFPAVRRTHAQQKLPGELILLDYFRPWTIP